MMERIREAVVRVTKTEFSEMRKLPVVEKAMVPLLLVASGLYSSVSLARRFLYRYRVFTPCRLPVPVVSVGNITWGGNGKTPMVEFLSSCFMNANICPLILIRGYNGGDEVRLLKNHLNGVKIGEGVNRANVAKGILDQNGILPSTKRKRLAEFLDASKSAHWSEHDLETHEIGVAILDDGMQHLNLARDLEIVMVNVLSLWGNKRMVPLGPLREPLTALQRAHVVVLHHADLVSLPRVKHVKDFMKKFLDAGALVICSRMVPHFFVEPRCMDIKAGLTQSTVDNARVVVPLTAVRGAAVLLVSGIGCPESVSLILQQLGASYVERMDFLDHHFFTIRDLCRVRSKLFELKCRFEKINIYLVLTEKDYMRDPAAFSEVHGVEVLVLHSSLEILANCKDKESLTSLLSAILTKNMN